MECFRCKGRDFKIEEFSFFNYAMIYCSGCYQSYLVAEKLQLIPIEVIGEVKSNDTNITKLNCVQCGALRMISSNANILSTQSCNRCFIESTPMIPAGDKIPWSEFTLTQHNAVRLPRKQ